VNRLSSFIFIIDRCVFTGCKDFHRGVICFYGGYQNVSITQTRFENNTGVEGNNVWIWKTDTGCSVVVSFSIFDSSSCSTSKTENGNNDRVFCYSDSVSKYTDELENDCADNIVYIFFIFIVIIIHNLTVMYITFFCSVCGKTPHIVTVWTDVSF
jgi:hypothetical protein